MHLCRLAVCALVLCVPASWLRASPCPGVALVLAIDGSGSVDDAEFALQMQATALALADPAVGRAFEAAGGATLAAVIWGDSAWSPQVIGWQRVDGPRDALRFAGRLALAPRRIGGNTDMAHGLRVALDLLESPGGCAARRVVDVSGDGRETLYARPRGASLAEMRGRAEAMGVVVNGLAIDLEDAGLPGWYAERVIAGEGAFVVAVTGAGSFREAMRRKLLREIGGGGPLLAWDPPPARPPG